MAKNDLIIETAGEVQIVSMRVKEGVNDPYSPWNKLAKSRLETPKSCKECLYYGRVCIKGCTPR